MDSLRKVLPMRKRIEEMIKIDEMFKRKYCGQIIEVIFFGSYVRGEKFNDVDILIVLNSTIDTSDIVHNQEIMTSSFVNINNEITNINHITKYGKSNSKIHVTYSNENYIESNLRSPIVQSIRREGIVVS